MQYNHHMPKQSWTQSCTTDLCVMHSSACPTAVGLCYISPCYVTVHAYTWAHFLQRCRDQKGSRVELHCLFVQSVNVLLIFPRLPGFPLAVWWGEWDPTPSLDAPSLSGGSLSLSHPHWGPRNAQALLKPRGSAGSIIEHSAGPVSGFCRINFLFFRSSFKKEKDDNCLS